MAASELPLPQPKKTFKILRIGSHNVPKRLLDLSPKLRDMIWSYTLYEAPLYNRRHKLGCIYYDDTSAFQIPPALIHYSRAFIPTNPYKASNADSEYCRKNCIRRQGLGLIKGVNKQIQHEASKIFWENEMPCFAENAIISRGSSLIPALKKIPEVHLHRIQKLALWQLENSSSVGSLQDSCATLLEILQNMPSLTHLEIPSALLDFAYDGGRISSLSNLRTLRVFALRTALMTTGDKFVNIYVAAGGQWSLPPCALQSCSNEDSQIISSLRWCGPCQDIRDDMLALIKDLQEYRTRRRDWTGPVAEKLAYIEPAQQGELPYKIISRLDEKRVNHVFYVWGLPVYCADTRAIEVRKSAKMKSRANVVSKPPTMPIFYKHSPESSNDFAVQGKAIFSRERRAVEKRMHRGKVLEEPEPHLKVSMTKAGKPGDETGTNSSAIRMSKKEMKRKKVAMKHAERQLS